MRLLNRFRTANLQAESPDALSCGAVVVILSLGIFLLKTSTLPLTDPDESRCAQIVQQMVNSGHWLVPYRDGQIYFDKPAPFFWMAAAVQTITGDVELGGRFVSAIAGAGTVLVVFLLGRRMANNLTGLMAGLILATGPEFFFVARWYRMDMPFTFFMLAALWWWWRFEKLKVKSEKSKVNESPAVMTKPTWQWVGFYIFCGLASLMKGPAGAALPVMVVGGYLGLSRNWRRLFEFVNVPGILAYLLITAPWYIAVSLTVPDYAYQFFIKQNLERYAGGKSFGHHFPGIAYVGIIFAGMMPWAIYLPAAVEKRFPWRWRERMNKPEVLFLWTAALLPLVFFAFSKTKMPNYILPVIPPLAILIAMPLAAWARSDSNEKAYRDATAVLCAALVLLPVALIAAQLRFRVSWPQTFLWAGLLSICAISAIRNFVKRRRITGINWSFAATVIATLAFIFQMAPGLFELMSQRRLGILVKEHFKKGDTVCYVPSQRDSFAIYAGADKSCFIRMHRENERNRLAELLNSGDDVYMLVDEGSLKPVEELTKRPLYLMGEYDKGAFRVFNHDFDLGSKFSVLTTKKIEPSANAAN